jgi:hypothetical protein
MRSYTSASDARKIIGSSASGEAILDVYRRRLARPARARLTPVSYAALPPQCSPAPRRPVRQRAAPRPGLTPVRGRACGIDGVACAGRFRDRDCWLRAVGGPPQQSRPVIAQLPPEVGAVDVTTLPAFSNHRAQCSECGARYPIRVHFDRGCRTAVGGDHFHRICPKGHEWLGAMLRDRGGSLWVVSESIRKATGRCCRPANLREICRRYVACSADRP